MSDAVAVAQVVEVREVHDYYDPSNGEVRRSVPWRPGVSPSDLAPAWPSENLQVWVDGVEVPAEWHDRPLEAGESVTFIKAPAGPVFTVLKAVALVAGLVGAARSLRLERQLGETRDQQIDRSTVYNWSGPITIYNGEGLPLPLWYGAHRVGGVAIGGYTEVVAGETPQTYLYLLLALSSGPIDSVGGVSADADGLTGASLPAGLQINGNDAGNFDDVTAYVRLGSLQQSVVPGFNAIPTRLTFDALLVESATDAAEIVTDFSEAEVVDMLADTEGDRARLTFFFPRGLYRIKSSGAVKSLTVQLQVRYVQLNGSGTPVGDYAVVPSAGTSFEITGKTLAPFSVQVEFPLYNPTTYVAPTLTGGYRFVPDGAFNRQRGEVALPLPTAPSWAPGTPIEALTFVSFVRLEKVRDLHPLWAFADWDEDDSDPRVEGIMLGVRDLGDGTGELEVTFGEGTGSGDLTERHLAGSIPHVEPAVSGVFIAVTWQRDFVPGLNRLRVFVNGALELEHTTSTDIISTAYASMLWNTWPRKETTTSGNWHARATFDEQRLYDREFTPEEVSAVHNSGVWLEAVDSEAGLVGGWRMDVAPLAPFFPPVADAEHVAMVMEASPSATGAQVVAEALVASDPGNTDILRARYRFEVQRTSVSHDGVPGSGDSDTEKQSAFEWTTLTTFVDEEVNYAGVALLGLKVLVTDQLDGGGALNVTVPIRGVANCPVWDGVDPDSPGFVKQYSANPAWCTAHMLLDAEQGAGHLYDEKSIPWDLWADWAAFCDVEVYDQRGRWGPPSTAGLTLGYESSGFGLDGAVYRLILPKPVPDHLVVGKRVRLADVANVYPSPGDWPEGDFTIRAVIVNDLTFELWCDWPDGVPAPGSVTINDATATVIGIEPRLSMGLGFADRGFPFLEARQLMCSIGRAVPISLGERLLIAYDTPRQPVAAFNAANVAVSSFRIGSVGTLDTWNRAVGEFQSADADYLRSTESRDHASLDDPSSTASVRRTLVDMRGVTSRSQVHRELQLMLNAWNTQRVSISFETVLDGMFLAPRDVIVVAHPMPDWAQGGRCPEPAPDSTSFYVDVPFELGQLNLLEHSVDFSEAAWEKLGSSPPSVASTQVAGPDGEDTAWAVTFDTGTANWLRQNVSHRGTGTAYTAIIWARLESGDADQVSLEIASLNQVLVSETLALTGEWVRFTVSGTSSQPFSTDPNVQLRLRLADAAPGAVVLHVDRPRLIVGADDGEDALREEATAAIPDAYACLVNPNGDNATVFARLAAKAGAFAAGELVQLAEDPGFVTQREWLWIVGHSQFASRQFEVTRVAPGQDFRTRIEAIEYSADIFPDEDAFETLDAPAQASQAAQQLIAGEVLPGMPTQLTLLELPERDAETGRLAKALQVSWTPDEATAHAVTRTRVWLREDAGDWEQAAEVLGGRTTCRVDITDRDAGALITVAVQPESRVGRTPLRRCRQATTTIYAVFPPPEAPVGARATLHGLEATYEVDLPQGFQDAVVQVFRGGAFVGQEVGRIPVGGRSLGPTSDWCRLPTAADGRGSPPLQFRMAMPNGGRGEHIELEAEPSLEGWPAAVVEDSWEDGPWDVATSPATEAPVLADLVAESPLNPSRPDRLTWDGASSSLEASYQSTVYDLGRARRVHVSCGIMGEQLPPLTADTVFGAASGLRARSLTAQGFLDPNHPDYGELGVHLEWAYSETSADPGTAFVPFRCGVTYLRSCRFRVRVTRPTTSWDVWITRGGVAIRPLPGDDLVQPGEITA